MPLKHPNAPGRNGDELAVAPLFGLDETSIPRRTLGRGELPPEVAHQIVPDELMLDGNARLNVATSVTTSTEPRAERLMAECFDKNMIDKDEYPQTAEMEMRCVNILAHPWHAPDTGQATGCSTTGSSEAAMLGGLAPKRRWQQARRAAGRPADRPNLVMGINVLAALRVVVRRSFTHDLADMLVGDLRRQLHRLERQAAPVHDPSNTSGFHH